MPMEFSGDSYPKLPVQQNDPLGGISKLQGVVRGGQEIEQGQQQIQRNAIGIDREKLAKYNEQYNLVHRTLGNLLATPEGQLTADSFMKAGQSMVNQKLMTPEQYAQFVTPLPTRAGSESDTDYEKKLRQYAGMHMLQAQEKHDAIGYFAGKTVDKDAGNQTVFGNEGRVHPALGGLTTSPFQQQGPSLGRNPAPGTPGVDQNNNPTFQQGAPPQYIAPPGAVQSAPLPPIKSKLPTQNVGPENAASNQERINQGGGASTFRPAPANQFSEGQKQVNEDLSSGSARLQAIKQPQQALKMMTPEILSGLTGTGPIGDKITKAISAVGGVLGLPKGLDDRVAARQEIVKKMNAYVSNSPVAGRSDAAQILAEASSPNPNAQNLKALVNLTRDAIALDRIHAAKSLDFMTDDKGNQVKNPDYSAYPFKRGRFPNAVDEDAFKLDLMSKEERKELQERKEKESLEAQQKFRTSVAMARKLGMY